jgi:hypothetical protein
MNKYLLQYKDPENRRQYLLQWARDYRKKHPEHQKEINERTKELRRKHKWQAIQYLGGHCISGKSGCNNIIATKENMSMFDIHHPEGIKKERGISTIMCRKWERIERQIKDCLLFCSNCHRLEHHQE